MQHVYSCMFGTFLFNNEQEREKDSLSPQLISIWSYLSSGHTQFINKLYTPNAHKVYNSAENELPSLIIAVLISFLCVFWQKLLISSQICDLQFWKDAYFSPSNDTHCSIIDQTGEESSSLVRSHSYSDFTVSTGELTWWKFSYHSCGRTTMPVL